MNRNLVGSILGRLYHSPFILLWRNLIQNLP
jgi:hypothetical protein